MDFPRSLAALIALAAVASAGSAAAQTASLPAANVAERAPAPLMLVARDPETGGWTLAPMESKGGAAAFEAAMAINQSSEGLEAEPLPGGGFILDLRGRFQSYAMAWRDLTGTLHGDCHENPLSLYRWLTAVPERVDGHGRPIQ